LALKYESRLIKWHKMARFNYANSDEEFDMEILESNLTDFFHKDPQKFLQRVAKGPPPCYRMAAWRIISGVENSKVEGLY